MDGYMYAVKYQNNTIEQLGEFSKDYRGKEFPILATP